MAERQDVWTNTGTDPKTVAVQALVIKARNVKEQNVLNKKKGVSLSAVDREEEDTIFVVKPTWIEYFLCMKGK